MKTLVTGGAGFIGSHIIRRLLAEGHEVRTVDDLSTGRLENLEGIRKDIDFVHGPIQDSSISRQAVRDVEIIFHQAALPSVPRSIEEPVASMQANVMGTTVLLHEAVRAEVGRVVYAASSSAYGDAIGDSKHEALLPRPKSPYAVSKLTGEYLLQAFQVSYGIETVGIRYFNVFGERQDPTSQYSGVIAKFSRLMLAGESPTIFGDGTTSRDFTYVSNVVDGNILAATGPSAAICGEVFNVACGGSITLNHLVATINDILSSSIKPKYVELRKGDIHHSRADITKARQHLGYEPGVSFRDGLARTLAWYASARVEASLT
jgi:nucleoside-diphosphate-sugar epimerase